MRGMRKLHLTLGAVLFVVFLVTGRYMRTHFPAAFAGNEAIRYLYRANHVYILMAALLNLALGAHLAAAAGVRRYLQAAGSVLLLVSAVLLVVAFYREPPLSSPHRPLTGYGMYTALAGTFAHTFAARRRAA
jgi:hypothetical protein